MRAIFAPVQHAAADFLSAAAPRLIYAALIGVAGCLACGFAIAALWTALAGALGSVAASLIMAAGFLFIALALYASDRLAAAERRKAAEAAEAAARARPPQPPLAEAFLVALDIGRALRRR